MARIRALGGELPFGRAMTIGLVAALCFGLAGCGSAEAELQVTASPAINATETPKPTGRPTPVPTDTPAPTDTPEPTPTPEPTDTPTPTRTPTPTPTRTPSPTPTETPTPEPTLAPTQSAAPVTGSPPGSSSSLLEAIWTVRGYVKHYGGAVSRAMRWNRWQNLECGEVIRLYDAVAASPVLSKPSHGPDVGWALDRYQEGVARFLDGARGLTDCCRQKEGGSPRDHWPSRGVGAGAWSAVNEANDLFHAAVAKLEELGHLSPTQVPTPAPSGPPSPPAPIPGTGSDLLATMRQVRGWIGEYGGWIDRAVRGEPADCEEIVRLYDSIVGATVYSMPADDPVLLWAHDRYREGVAVFEDGARDLAGHCRELMAGNTHKTTVATLTWTRASIAVRDADHPFHEAISRLEQDGY